MVVVRPPPEESFFLFLFSSFNNWDQSVVHWSPWSSVYAPRRTYVQDRKKLQSVKTRARECGSYGRRGIDSLGWIIGNANNTAIDFLFPFTFTDIVEERRDAVSSDRPSELYQRRLHGFTRRYLYTHLLVLPGAFFFVYQRTYVCVSCFFVIRIRLSFFPFFYGSRGRGAVGQWGGPGQWPDAGTSRRRRIRPWIWLYWT